MISSNDLRPGITVELDGQVWQCIEFLHVKPGKGAAFVRAKLKNLQSGSVVERKFNAGIKLQPATVERKPMQYLYEADGSYCFMDTETYEQIMLNKEQLGDKINFLKEEMECNVVFFNGTIIGVDIPNSVELKVVETEPGIHPIDPLHMERCFSGNDCNDLVRYTNGSQVIFYFCSFHIEITLRVRCKRRYGYQCGAFRLH